MQQATLTRAGFTLGDADVPAPQADEFLIRTTACGVCGGDVHVYRTRDALATPELLLGHEGAGIIVAKGDEASGFEIGDRITAIGGAYADFFVARASDLVKLPDAVNAVHALGEPIACCVHAGDRFGMQPGASVAVVGCGFMGLVCLQIAKLQGAGEIVAIDPVAYRREMAGQLGAARTLHPDDIRVDDPWTGEFDLVIEAAGGQAALDLCGDLVAHHGRIVLIGYHESNDGMRDVNMKLWNFKAIDVVNGHVRRHDEKRAAMEKGIRWLAEGKLVTEPLVRQYALENVDQAFRDFEANDDGLFKAVLIPDADDK
ncbi:MAG: zinc-binding dehydrogenase [Pseudomonadota bacterium]